MVMHLVGKVITLSNPRSGEEQLQVKWQEEIEKGASTDKVRGTKKKVGHVQTQWEGETDKGSELRIRGQERSKWEKDREKAAVQEKKGGGRWEGVGKVGAGKVSAELNI